MLIVIGDATAAPGRRDELVAAARAVAAATRGDRGCLAYSFTADLENENRILSIEVWADQAALDEHMTHPHTAEFLRAAPALVADEPIMSFYEVSNPRGGRLIPRAGARRVGTSAPAAGRSA